MGVSNINENGGAMVQVWAERKILINKIYFRKKDTQKYAWVSDITGDKSLIDYVPAKRVFKEKLPGPNVL